MTARDEGRHVVSIDDRRFRAAFEACAIAPEAFDHRSHVRLAYVYLVENDVETAVRLMRDSLNAFIRFHGIPSSKYHETLTRAWILAVRHFMAMAPPSASADAFIAHDSRLLDSKIMQSHYSAEVLFSPEVRETFVEPDRAGIPRHE